jgi:hypothetical protein
VDSHRLDKDQLVRLNMVQRGPTANERKREKAALSRASLAQREDSESSRLTRKSRAAHKREAEKRFTPAQYEAHLNRRRTRGW